MSNTGRIGVYGGTFDPIHNAHLDVARAAMQHGNLRKVLFVVASIPPHKQHDVFASPEDRLAMVNAALADDPDFVSCDLELHRTGPSYTIDTLRELHDQYPEDELVLIMGHDSLADLPQWRDCQGILEKAYIFAVPRAGTAEHVPESLAGHYEEIPFTPMDVSSTEIRRRVAAGDSFADKVPRGVAEYIKQQGLYSHGNRTEQSVSGSH